MEISEYQNIYQHEGEHFYYISNHKIILSLIKKYAPDKDLKILDAGCGTGLLTKRLSQFGKVVAIDIHPQAIRFSKERGINVRKASVNKLPFKDSSFDLIVCIDVLYHREVDDQKALQEFYRILKPSGLLVLRVPANQWLNLAHDKYVHSRERYSKNELQQKLLKASFKIEKLSSVNLALLPVATISHLIQMIKPANNTKSFIGSSPALINKILTVILSSESYLLNWLDLPFGLGLIAVARKS